LSEQVFSATTAEHYQAFAGLVAQYLAWSRARYLDDVWFVEQVFGHQSLDSELQELPARYGPPNGRALLVSVDGEIAGAGAYRRLSETICEMKRLFVSDRFKGRGLGRKLCEALITSARAEQFTLMRLDTGNRLVEAIAMYKAVGFTPCAPYHEYPEALRPYLIFMELSLL
jgi:GNAT superfamily N-acetyltransferase